MKERRGQGLHERDEHRQVRVINQGWRLDLPLGVNHKAPSGSLQNKKLPIIHSGPQNYSRLQTNGTDGTCAAFGWPSRPGDQPWVALENLT
jgi:hypothetical protein